LVRWRGRKEILGLVKLTKLVLDSDVETAMFCLDHFVGDKLRVWILSESSGQNEWNGNWSTKGAFLSGY
jgi:hypothetical protein